MGGSALWWGGSDRIEIDEDLSGFRAFSGADVATAFKDVEDTCGAGVTEAEAALEQGGACLPFLAHDLDAFF